MWTWIVNRLMMPSFDRPDAQMPEMGITREEAEAIAEQLVGGSLRSRIRKFVSNKYFAGGLAVGAAGASGALVVAALAFWLVRRRTA